ncbi:hypothetical protein J2X16_003527 [Pelomonas aquatica]|uniref:Thoeris protein ThsB TIR-like domain-containing protein n=1 Tax=Pelomonas aquatica TaxID=431058 RepID=A0ABU1ZCK1_9BURK|nr:TIR domain-containing protein [Pelomonas aquatica]MDR7298178.1 hypothetical protein [Pelomonas aquatica]
MARRTFFSFHHVRDNWRVGQVRNCWVTQQREAAGFWDAAEWEKVKLQTPEKIREWIDKQLVGTSVTVVLIGHETSTRPYVKYEIEQSIARGNGLLGIFIHNMKDVEGKTDLKGTNPLPAGYKTYDWVNDDGRSNIGDWIEAAAKAANR